MKISIPVLATAVVLCCCASCKKENDTACQIEGRWTGTYVNEASGNSFYYSFRIKPGGIIEEFNAAGQKTGEGTWNLQNDILTAAYRWPGGSSYSIIAAFYKKEGKLLGDWGYGKSATSGGTWKMQKY